MMYTKILVSFTLVICLWLSLATAQTCDSCGKECQSACGTRGFRTCCLNYLKKRTDSLAGDTEIRLPFIKALSRFTQNYPSLRSFILPEERDESSTKKILVDKSSAERLKCSEYD